MHVFDGKKLNFFLLNSFIFGYSPIGVTSCLSHRDPHSNFYNSLHPFSKITSTGYFLLILHDFETQGWGSGGQGLSVYLICENKLSLKTERAYFGNPAQRKHKESRCLCPQCFQPAQFKGMSWNKQIRI